MELESEENLRHSAQNRSEFEELGQVPSAWRSPRNAAIAAILGALSIAGVAMAQNGSDSTSPSAVGTLIPAAVPMRNTNGTAAVPAVVAIRSLAISPQVVLSPTNSERSRPLILIDPGHGGTNSGAPSIRPDIFEKHLTLAMAGGLRTRLEAQGFEVKLTRSHDTYLTLRQRGLIANEMDADLFVSLHGNATESHSQSGFETFILTPEAVDIDTRALRQNSGRVRAGVSPDTAAILDDIERSTSQLQAAEIAASIQENMRELRGKAGDRGVRQDSMHVLLGATMPAVLIEVGFIDHPIEGEELMDAAVRGKILDAIADAIGTHAETIGKR